MNTPYAQHHCHTHPSRTETERGRGTTPGPANARSGDLPTSHPSDLRPSQPATPAHNRRASPLYTRPTHLPNGLTARPTTCLHNIDHSSLCKLRNLGKANSSALDTPLRPNTERIIIRNLRPELLRS
ncbi:hypothetical protein BV898_19772 [Hypsibius exemplaris]|uniref:Uncharacterized protein n=1 Tax=Hypsibius exemplaris TaxID=2072580 RepID=A0A9X6NM70_HYPEX|nr:hypothetical protein BV898_19772 [Hypsibius exemplaris]